MMDRAIPCSTKLVCARPSALMAAIVLAVSIGCHTSARVASSGACPPQPLNDARFGVRYLPCQLSTAPVLQIDTANWRYPDMMRSAGMSGRVRATFVVDTAGRYAPGSARIVSTSQQAFSALIRFQLSKARFSPGRRGRQAVAVEMTQDFVYVIPANASTREVARLEELPVILIVQSSHGVPALEIHLDAEDTTLGPPPAPVLRDSLAHEAIRTRARGLGWTAASDAPASGSTALLICVQGDTSVFESAADRALATSMTRPHVRVMTMRGCPPTRASMAVPPPGAEPIYPPDSVPFIEPHRLQVTGVAMRRRGGPQVDLFDEYLIGGEEYRCVREPRASSVFVLRCLMGDVVGH